MAWCCASPDVIGETSTRILYQTCSHDIPQFDVSSASMPCSMGPPSSMDESLSTTLQIEPSDLAFDQLIGRGSTKAVYLGRWRSTSVAIVCLLDSHMTLQPMDMVYYSCHPNMVQFHRYSMDAHGHICMVMQLVHQGALDKALRIHGHKLKGVAKLAMCEQICGTMLSLAAENVLHGNLSCRNILVSSLEPLHLKVSDYGLTAAQPLGDAAGANPHIPPEVFAGEEWTEKGDVWSFGVTMWEIYSNGRKPDREALQQLSCPAMFPDHAHRIMLRCCHPDPEKRPSFARLSKVFKTLSALHQHDLGVDRPLVLHPATSMETTAPVGNMASLEPVEQWGQPETESTISPGADAASTQPSDAARMEGVPEFPLSNSSCSGLEVALSEDTTSSNSDAAVLSSSSDASASAGSKTPSAAATAAEGGFAWPSTSDRSSGPASRVPTDTRGQSTQSPVATRQHASKEPASPVCADTHEVRAQSPVSMRQHASSSHGIQLQLAVTIVCLAMAAMTLDLRQDVEGLSWMLVPVIFAWPYMAMLVCQQTCKASAGAVPPVVMSKLLLAAILCRRAVALALITGLLHIPLAYKIMMQIGLDMPIEVLMVFLEGPGMYNVLLTKLVLDIPIKYKLFNQIGMPYALARAFLSDMAGVGCWWLMERCGKVDKWA